jgi:cardiolipin synthase
LDPTDQVRLIVDGRKALGEREKLLASANACVDLATSYFQADGTGWNIAHWLVECARRGVRVRVLVDRSTLERMQRLTPGLASLVEILRQSGVEVHLWHDARRPFDCTHRKMLVVDGQVAVVGSRNVADDPRSQDVDLMMAGPSVSPLSELFESIWQSPPTGAAQDASQLSQRAGTARVPRQSSQGAAAARDPRRFSPWFDHQPRAVLRDPTVVFALGRIAAARQTLVLELAHLAGPTLLTRGLVDAARRGVRVRVLTSSSASADRPNAPYAAYAAMRQLLARGVDVRVRPGAGRTVGSTYLVVDDAWVAFGSHNLDYYSSRFCCETTLQVESPALAEQLTACFEDAARDARRVDLQAEVLPFLKRSPRQQLLKRLFPDFH